MVIEDSQVRGVDLIMAGIPDRIVRAVALLTRRKPDDYATYIQKLKLSGDAMALQVKLADLRDHLRPNVPASLKLRYLAAWKVLTGDAYPESPETKGGE